MAKRREPEMKLGGAQFQQVAMVQAEFFAVGIAVDDNQCIRAWGCCNPVFAVVVENQVFAPYALGIDPQIALLRLAKRKWKTAGLG